MAIRSVVLAITTVIAMGTLLTLGPRVTAFPGNAMLMSSGTKGSGGGGGGGGIPCAIGPSFTGTIPAAASNAGMTTCLFNFDPSTPTYSNPATYINCLGASTPLFYNADPGNTGGSGCNFTVGTDPTFTNTALISTYGTSTAPGCSGSTCQLFLMTATSDLTTIAASFPNGYYEEIYRTTPTWSCTSAGNPGCANPMTSFWSWGSSGQAAGANDEHDFIETYGANLGNEYDAGYHNGGSSSAFVWQGATTFLGAGYDPTQYNTYGELFTSDGSTSAYECSIINGNNIATCLNVPIVGTSYSARRVLISNNGTSTTTGTTCNNTPGGPCNVISGFTSVTKYTKAIHVFGCPGGGTTNSGGNCFGSTFVNGTNLKYWH